MCDFHRSFEANSDFTDTEDSQQLVLDDNWLIYSNVFFYVIPDHCYYQA